MGGTAATGPVADFCAQLKKLHAASGLTQRALARHLNVSEAQVSTILNGKIARPPSWDLVEKIVIACHCRDREDGGRPGDRTRLLTRWHARHADLEDAFERHRHLPPALKRQAADAVPAVPAAPQVRYSLPADTAAFTGRDVELGQITAAVKSAVQGGRVVIVGAIDGMPGVGKTALAIHVAHVLAARFPDRQLFIDLHAHAPGHEPTRPEDALAGLLAAVGVDPRHLPDDLGGRAAMWRDQMSGQRALLVLDNAADSDQVTPLLPGGGGCLVLVTSRRHLGDLPGAVTPVLVDVLPPHEAAEMFTRLAPRTTGDHEGVAEVARLAGFLPLAICLLARVLVRHPSWTLADLISETLAGVLTLAAENDSVTAAFEVSYRHLESGAQRLFRLLGVHPGTTIDSYAAAALAGIGQKEAAGLLDGLHREGMLTEAGYRQYGMHDLLRRYARDLAADTPGDSQQALSGLLDYYQHAAAVAGTRLDPSRPAPPGRVPFEIPALNDAEQALAWARRDRASLLACLDLAVQTGEHARVVALTAGLAAVLRRDGPWAEAVTCHTTAVDAARHLSDQLGEANALSDLGDVRRLTGDYLGAAGVLEQALSIYRDLGNRIGEANTLTYLGILRQMTDGYPDATGTLEQALSIYRDLGDRPGEARALHNLGILRQITDDYPDAGRSLDQARSIYRDLGDRLGEANTLTYLGMVRRVTGDHPGAAKVLEQALAIYRDLGSRIGEANALNTLGTVRKVSGDHQGAAKVLEQALAIYRDLGSRVGEANALNTLGTVRRLTGDYPGAAKNVQEALDIFCDIGDRQGQAEAYNEQGTLHRLRRDLANAPKCHQQALDLARASGSSLDEAGALAGLGRCALAAGDAAEAEALLRQAHQVFQRIGAAEALGILAELDSLPSAARE